MLIILSILVGVGEINLWKIPGVNCVLPKHSKSLEPPKFVFLFHVGLHEERKILFENALVSGLYNKKKCWILFPRPTARL